MVERLTSIGSLAVVYRKHRCPSSRYTRHFAGDMDFYEPGVEHSYHAVTQVAMMGGLMSSIRDS